MKKNIGIIAIIVNILALGIILSIVSANNNVSVAKLDNMITGTWQAEVKFPDWKGYIDDTLAMNSMYSFDGVKDQGKLYFTVNKDVKSFDLFINNKKINTSEMKDGIFEVDMSSIALNGTNTLQVSNIVPNNLENAISVNIPYPRIIDGSLKDVRFK